MKKKTLHNISCPLYINLFCYSTFKILTHHLSFMFLRKCSHLDSLYDTIKSIYLDYVESHFTFYAGVHVNFTVLNVVHHSYIQVWEEKHSFGLIHHGDRVWLLQRICKLLRSVCSAEISHWVRTDRNQHQLSSSQ